MHLTRVDIHLLLGRSLPSEHAHVWQAHIEGCEFCQHLVDEVRQELNALAQGSDCAMPPQALVLRDMLFNRAMRGLKVNLIPLTDPAITLVHTVLAADGPRRRTPQIENVGEYYSANPEMVLRLMRSQPEERLWVQLIAENPALTSHVLLRLPELDCEFLTDESGCANMPNVPDNQLERLKFEVKLPELNLALDTLQYDPEKTEYSAETVLETSHHDRVRVTLEGKTEGHKLTLEFLELAGISSSDPVTAFAIKDNSIQRGTMTGAQTATFELRGDPKALTIRLFKS